MKIRITIQNKDTQEDIFRDYEFIEPFEVRWLQVIEDMINQLRDGDKDEKIPF